MEVQSTLENVLLRELNEVMSQSIDIKPMRCEYLLDKIVDNCAALIEESNEYECNFPVFYNDKNFHLGQFLMNNDFSYPEDTREETLWFIELPFRVMEIYEDFEIYKNQQVKCGDFCEHNPCVTSESEDYEDEDEDYVE